MSSDKDYFKMRERINTILATSLGEEDSINRINALVQQSSGYFQELGLYSTGFLFRRDNLTYFIKSIDAKDPLSINDFYLVGNRNTTIASDKAQDIVRQLFYLVRQQQIKTKPDKNKNTEEYLINFSDSNSTYYYVDMGKIYHDCLLWRRMCWKPEMDMAQWYNSWRWFEVSIQDFLETSSSGDLRSNWKDFLDEKFTLSSTRTNGPNWHDEVQVLLGRPDSFQYQCLNSYLKEVDTSEPCFLAELANHNYRVPSDIFDAHRFSFPIPPFYFWNTAFPDRPSTYLVSQVWMSRAGRISLQKNDDSHDIVATTSTVGVSLSMVSPVKTEDRTLPELNIYKSADSIANLIRVLDLLAMPLVENIFYDVWKDNSFRNAITAARAAVFARNFSHITGSHVISNPEFRNSLAGYQFVHGLRRCLDETYSNFLCAENRLIEYIIQTPSRAEELWSQGTKALADARDKLGTGDVFQENTRRFHEYLQGRFDFIARAIDVTQDPPEPVWFVRDLLEGFLRQTAYLDNLVADIGLRLDNMEFYFKIEDQEFRAQWIQSQSAGKGGTDRLPADFPFEIEWNIVTNADPTVPNTRVKTIYELDKMVALPGGIAAAHAFYSLLENIIRNSAKYGDLKRCTNDKYKLTVELTPQIENISQRQPLQTLKSPISCFRLRIWDNYSSAVLVDKDCAPLAVDKDADNQPWRYLQTKLEKKFVKDNGQPETDDLGMMEMQACSQLLCRPDSDGNYLRANDKDPGKAIRTKFNLNVLSPDCSYRDDKYTFLTFELIVEVPILLGCLTDKHPGHFSISFYTDDVQKLIGKAPFLMVIDGDWLQKPGNINLLSKENLPNRTLILYSTHIRDNQDIRGAKSCTNKKKHTRAFAGRKDDENELLLILYRTWIQKWKKPPKPPDPDRQGKWHLWVGLERQAQQVQEAWEKQANEYFRFGSDPLVELMVKSYSAGQNEAFKTNSIQQIYDSTASNKRGNDKPPGADSGATTPNDSGTSYWHNDDISLKSALVFDNHGNCFKEAYKSEKSNSLQSSSRFYQKLSGSVSPDLFRMLSRPPQDKFSFCFFIYSLVEACLTNVVVIDERLAWSLVEGYGVNESNTNFAQDLLEHQKAGIYPVFRFRRYKQGSDQAGFYNKRHRDRLQDCIGDASKVEGPENPLNKEGIIIDAENLPNSSLHILTRKQISDTDSTAIQLKVIKTESSSTETKSEDSLGVDVILIHEGAMDILTDQMGVKWVGVDNVDKDEHSRQLQALYQLAPIIIRTSGRGRKSKLLGEHLPFIEFGQVSSSLLTARNKFALVRGLLGSVGSKRTDG